VARSRRPRRVARQILLFGLAALLLSFALVPLAVLLLASGLPTTSVQPNGIPFEAFSQWRGPRLSLLWESPNRVLWSSLARTMAIAISVSLASSTVAVVGTYLVTRRRSPIARRATQFLALAAYGVPSVFLLMAVQPLLLRVPMTSDARVWLLHFFYILPMAAILTLGYATAHPHLLDRSAAIDGARWRSRLVLAYRANLWRGHLAVASIGALISWGDIVFSQQILSGSSKLLVDLYILRYFENDSTVPDYPGASLFALILAGIAVALALVVAATNRRGI